MNCSSSIPTDFSFSLKFAILTLVVCSISIGQFDEFKQLDGPYGFRVNKIRITNTDEIYLCTSWEGIFYSENSGESWSNLGLKNEDIHELIIDSKGNLFALILSYWDHGRETAGILKSIDNGNTWKISNSGITNPAVRAITVDKNDNLFVSTKNGGVFFSENNGETWTNIGLEDLFIRVIEADEKGRVFTGIDGKGIYYKDSDSTNWEKLGDLKFSRCQDIHISNNGDVYVALGSPIGSMGVYKYNNLTGTWNSVNNGLDDLQVETVFKTVNGTLLAGATNGRVYVSLDEGESWNLSTIGLTSMDVTSIRGNSGNEIFFGTLGSGLYKYKENNQEWEYTGPKIHLAVNGVVEFNNNLFCTTGPGIYFSKDKGQNWIGMSKNIPTRELSGIVMHDSLSFVVGTWGGGVYFSENSCSTWNVSAGIPSYSTVYFIEKSPLTNNIFVGVIGDGHGLYKSVDGGKSFYRSMEWERPEAIHITSAGEIYVGTWDIHYSNNDGESWKRLRKGISYISCLTIDKNGKIFAASRDGFLYTSDDKGLTWSEDFYPSFTFISLNLLESGEVVSSTYEGSNYIFTEQDRNWTKIEDPWFNKINISKIVYNDGNILVTTSRGLFSRKGLVLSTTNNYQNLPDEIELFNAYPNPFNPNTNISFSLNKSSKVMLKIFDLQGREMATLINSSLESGIHSIIFDGSNYSSGIYFYKLITDAFQATRKIVLMK